MEVSESNLPQALIDWSRVVCGLYQDHPDLREVDAPDEVPHEILETLMREDEKIITLLRTEVVDLPRKLVMACIEKALERSLEDGDPHALSQEEAEKVASLVVSYMIKLKAQLPEGFSSESS